MADVGQWNGLIRVDELRNVCGRPAAPLIRKSAALSISPWVCFGIISAIGRAAGGGAARRGPLHSPRQLFSQDVTISDRCYHRGN